MMSEVEDFVLRLLNKNVQPFTKVRRHHVHEAESGDNLVPGQIQFGSVKKDKLHLDDAQHHSGDWSQR